MFYKIIFDLIFVLLSLPFFIILILTIALLSFFINNSKIFFYQDRSGLKGKKFTIYKFKTIYNGKINKFNNFLRVTKLDEIPQIFNIIKGDVTLIGPRPLLYEYNKLYKKKHLARFKIKPGLTGWAQIHFKPGMKWEKRLNYDIWYVKNYSFGLDVKILKITICKIIKSFFTKKKDHAETEYFNGKN